MHLETTSDSIKEILNQHAEKFNRAEKAIKEIEVLTLEGVVSPALNEIRYAGQHFIRCFGLDDMEQIKKCSTEAERHLRRAIYEAYDAGISFYIEKCHRFKTQYEMIPLTDVLTEYVKQLQSIERIQEELIAENRTVEKNDNKEEYSELKKPQFDTLKTISRQWEAGREELNKALKRKIREDRKFLLTTALAVLGILATIVFGAIALCG